MSHAIENDTYILEDQPLSVERQFKLFKIADEMSSAGLPKEFIVLATKKAFVFDGIADLLFLWSNENNENERQEIVADIQEVLEDCLQHEKVEYPHVKLNDLESIVKDIRGFKDSLLLYVNEKSSIGELSKKTGIPQPSLSRFFSSPAMPRRSTLLKIAKALHLDAIKISTRWSI